MLNQIAVIGMAVMGKNLAYNLADRGFRVSVFNRTPGVAQAAVEEAPDLPLTACDSLDALVRSLERPRKILLMVQAGRAVDSVLDSLTPLLEPGDIVIDGGNSFFHDTERRMLQLAEQGLGYCGLGVSGGEKGARFGPALMPGCAPEVYEQLRPFFDAIAAKAKGEEPCAAYLGKGGAGHYVKMVHNGIEYADMAIIVEIYDLMRTVAGLSPADIADRFEEWNLGDLKSYLLEITIQILRVQDPRTGKELLDSIEDIARQKGTGMWTNREAIERGVEVSVLAAGLGTRVVSMLQDLRKRAEALFPEQTQLREQSHQETIQTLAHNQTPGWLDALSDALYAARLLAYAQGFALYREADSTYGWNLDYFQIASTFRAGCIIRSALLEPMREAWKRNAKLEHLLLDPQLGERLRQTVPALREVVIRALSSGIAVPALSAALTYFDGLTRAHSPANLLQAQRDFFGAHTYQRKDLPGFFHNEWEDVPMDEQGRREASEVQV